MGVKVREKPKSSGIYWIFIDHNGKRRAKKVGKDKRTALQLAKVIEAKLVLGEGKPEEKSSVVVSLFKDYAENWITVNVPAMCKPSTIMDYTSILKNHVIPKFGKYPIAEIRRGEIKQFLIKKISDGLAKSTVCHMKSCISGVLNLAVDDEVITANPAQRLGKIFNAARDVDEITPLKKEELTHLLDIFQKHYPDHYPHALTLARTGMRMGGSLALKWGDIDFNGRFIWIQRTFSRRLIGIPKSGKKRKVDMSLQLTEVLKSHKLKAKQDALKNGKGVLREWVFVNKAGSPVDIDNWRIRVFHKALEKAGLRQIRVHDLRHTYASLLIQAGESLVYVRDQLGHHSIKVTVDIYGHLSPEGNKDAVDRLDDVFEYATKRNLSATSQ